MLDFGIFEDSCALMDLCGANMTHGGCVNCLSCKIFPNEVRIAFELEPLQLVNRVYLLIPSFMLDKDIFCSHFYSVLNYIERLTDFLTLLNHFF